MSSTEYKTIPAPRRVKKIKGIKGPDATLAKIVEGMIAEQAAEGWDYVGTDTFPVEEKSGFFSGRETVLRGVMVFRRGGRETAGTMQPPAAMAPQPAPAQPAAAPAAQPAEPVIRAPGPAPSPDAEDDFVARPVGSARSD